MRSFRESGIDLWVRHKANIGLAILCIYVVALAIATANEIVAQAQTLSSVP